MSKIDYVRHTLSKLKNPIFLDYPVEPKPRWGFGRPYHGPLELRIVKGMPGCLELIKGIDYAFRLQEISQERPPRDAGQPYWRNEWISPVDGISIIEMMRRTKPKTYLEVGSGMSTRFARHATRMFGLATRIVSIDPSPRVEVDKLCDEVIRQRLEDCDLSRLPPLQAGDVLFVDNSHRAFQNSDVTVFFLEILPLLPKGVIVGIHDIFLPADYPPEWAGRYYSEQYLLAAWLLANPESPEILWPVFHSCLAPATQAELKKLLERIFPTSGDLRSPGGGAFWFRTS
jgi:hypothetical protein